MSVISGGAIGGTAGGIFGPSALLRKLRNKKDEADKGDK